MSAAVGAQPGRIVFFAQTTRARVLPVMAAPVLVGTALAWDQQHTFNVGLFLLTLVGALAAHLGANVINDVFDFRSGADQKAAALASEQALQANAGFWQGGADQATASLQAPGEQHTVPTGSVSLLTGQMTLPQYWRISAVLFGLALACGLALTFLGRPWTLAFAIGGFLLAFFYVAPPIRLAYIGRGAGEVDILISFGVLPLVGAFYVQAGTVTWQALAVSMALGLYTMMVLYCHHFLHWRADRAVGKMSPVAALGEERARKVACVLLAVVAAVILIDSIVGALPWYAALAALTTLLPFLALRKADGSLPGYFRLMEGMVNGSSLAGLIILVAIIIQGIVN
jgi:1,4-dihydroxy-2-naphthoate octaprenyltransferase